MQKHSELVLSKGPIAYYPLDKDLLNYADTSRYPASSSTIFNGTNDTAATVFFRGFPLVAGLSAACYLKNSSSDIWLSSHGIASSLGKPRSLSLEFYHNTEVADDDSRNKGDVLRLYANSTEFKIHQNANIYTLSVKRDSDTTVMSCHAPAGLVNRPNQIVVVWTPDYIVFSVNGNVSNSIPVSDVDWNLTSSSILLPGVGTSGTSYRRFDIYNAISIFPYALSKEEIDELRRAATQSQDVYSAVRFYGGDFISCTGLNVEKIGQFTVTDTEDFDNAYYMEGIVDRNGSISYPDLTKPEYTDSIPLNLSNQSGGVYLATGSGKHIDYSNLNEIKGADVFGAIFRTKGAGNYTAKEYVITMQNGQNFLGIYTQSQNAYYEYINSADNITQSGTIATGIDGYLPVRLFAGISKRTNEIVFGASSTFTYASIYSAASKVSADFINVFFSSPEIRVGGDIREELDTTTHFTGHTQGIMFSFPTSLTDSGFYPAMASIYIDAPNSGIFYSGSPESRWIVPSELISDFDGISTSPGAVVAYIDGDSTSIKVGLSDTPTSSPQYTVSVPGASVANIPNSTDVTGKYYSITSSSDVLYGEHAHSTTNAIELVAYAVNSSGEVEIVDGRSEFVLRTGTTMHLPYDNPEPSQRGPMDGLRNIRKSTSVCTRPTIYVPSGKSIYGIAFAVWVDSNSSDYHLDNTDYTNTNLMSISGSGGFTLGLAASTTTKYNAINIINPPTGSRVYINGKYVTYSGGTPTSPGELKTNAWNHVFISLPSPMSGDRNIIFDKDFTANGSFFSSFELGICWNDIAIFADSIYPSSTTEVDRMANRLAATYFGTGQITNGIQDCLVSVSESALPIKIGDGVSTESVRQWKPLIS